MSVVRMKALKIVTSVVTGIFIGIGVLIAFPQILFRHEIEHGNFTVLSTERIHENIQLILDSVTQNLEASPLYQPDLNQEIYLCNDYRLYSFLCYPSRTTFAGNFQKKVFIANPDVSGNKAYRRKDKKIRSLTNLITHETVHTLIINEIGFFSDMKLPAWQKEGYCDYIAKGSTPLFNEGISELCAGTNPRSYFPYLLAVKYLIEEKGISHRNLLMDEFNSSQIMTAVKQRHCESCVIQSEPLE